MNEKIDDISPAVGQVWMHLSPYSHQQRADLIEYLLITEVKKHNVIGCTFASFGSNIKQSGHYYSSRLLNSYTLVPEDEAIKIKVMLFL